MQLEGEEETTRGMMTGDSCSGNGLLRKLSKNALITDQPRFALPQPLAPAALRSGCSNPQAWCGFWLQGPGA
jgi:hypothetical protein